MSRVCRFALMRSIPIDRTEATEIAHALADAAREAILPYFRDPGLQAADKGTDKPESGFDPVTEADRAAEKAMRQILSTRRPDDGVLGEEFGETRSRSGLTWVLDPIDGTRGFMSGTPTWGVLIALSDADGPVYGVIDQPYIGERFEGGLGHAAMTGPLGQRALRTKGDRSLEEAILFTTFPGVGTGQEAQAFETVARHVKLTRFGMDCYAYALLAAGQIDLVIEAGLEPYDIQAPIAVIEAAGGLVTDWSGGPAHAGGRVIAAAGAQQHRAAMSLLAPFV